MAVIQAQVLQPNTGNSLMNLANSLAARRSQGFNDVLAGVNTGLNAVKTVADIVQTQHLNQRELDQQKEATTKAAFDSKAINPQTGVADPQWLDAQMRGDANLTLMASDSVRYAQTGTHKRDPKATNSRQTAPGMASIFGEGWQNDPMLADYAANAGDTLDGADLVTLRHIAAAKKDITTEGYFDQMQKNIQEAPAAVLGGVSMTPAAAAPVAGATAEQIAAQPAGTAPAPVTQATSTTGQTRGEALRGSSLGGAGAPIATASNIPIIAKQGRAPGFDPAQASPNELVKAYSTGLQVATAKIYPPALKPAVELAWNNIAGKERPPDASGVDPKVVEAAAAVMGNRGATPQQVVDSFWNMRNGIANTVLANGKTGKGWDIGTSTVSGKPVMELYMPATYGGSASILAGETVPPATATTSGGAGAGQAEMMTVQGASNESYNVLMEKVANGAPLDNNDRATMNDTTRVLKKTFIVNPDKKSTGGKSAFTDAERVQQFKNMNGFDVTPSQLMNDLSIKSAAGFLGMQSGKGKIVLERRKEAMDFVENAIGARDNLAKMGMQWSDAQQMLITIPEIVAAKERSDAMEARKLQLEEGKLNLGFNQLASDNANLKAGGTKAGGTKADPSVITDGMGMLSKISVNYATANGRMPNDKELKEYIAKDPDAKLMYGIWQGSMKAAGLQFDSNNIAALAVMQSAALLKKEEAAKLAGQPAGNTAAAPAKPATIPTLQTGMESKPAVRPAAVSGYLSKFQ